MKCIVFINGKPRSGKDSFVSLVQKHTKFFVYNYSMVASVREIMTILGVKEVKTECGTQRRQMADCKDYLQQFNLPYQHCIKTVKELDKNKANFIMFIHAREPVDIQRLTVAFTSLGYSTTNVYINRDVDIAITNHADENVDKFEYKHYIDNNGTLEEFEQKAAGFIQLLIT